jgi:hypothetical protein
MLRILLSDDRSVRMYLKSLMSMFLVCLNGQSMYSCQGYCRSVSNTTYLHNWHLRFRSVNGFILNVVVPPVANDSAKHASVVAYKSLNRLV